MNKEKLEKCVIDCYRELFKNSKPKGNYDKLIQRGVINEFGQKTIPYDKYVLSFEKQRDIIEKVMKENKISEINKQIIRNTVTLGCSPKYST